MSITAQRPDARTSSVDEAPAPRRHGRALALLVGGLAVVTVGAIVVWNLPHDAAPVPASSSPDLSAYAPGGAVYDAQVPGAVTPWTSWYGPGSTIYGEQVPTAPTPWTTWYGPGSTIYAEQVPSAG